MNTLRQCLGRLARAAGSALATVAGLSLVAVLAWFAAWQTGVVYLAVGLWERRPDVVLAGALGLAALVGFVHALRHGGRG